MSLVVFGILQFDDVARIGIYPENLSAVLATVSPGLIATLAAAVLMGREFWHLSDKSRTADPAAEK
ncbi:hypothetical protein [Bradyrhizobium sp. RDI18]|uniref:hypothetical protein n=1 Tax=Bradyrhizobium sp. RDI18 TaxID=3367400 RepID=UPI0037141AEB